MSKPGILVIDDDAGTCETLSDIFQEKGYRVAAVSTGHDALDKANSNSFNVALVDISLPDMEGTVLLRKFAENYPEMACIIITGHASLNNAISALKDGARGYFIKPLVMEEVLLRVDEVLERQRLQLDLEKSEEKFRTYYEKAPLGYQSLDENGCFIDVNETWLHTMQYSREEVTGRSFADFLAPDYIEKFRENFPCFKRDGEIHGIEFKMICRDGSVLIMSISGQIGYDRDGNFKQTHCILNDISEYRKLEKALLEVEERERQRIGYELHDNLGQLLTGISFMAQYLENNLKEKIIPKVEDVADIKAHIVEAKKQVRQLVKGIVPVETDREGLMTALRELSSSTENIFKVSCDFQYDKMVPIYNGTAVAHLYHIAQEAVSNAVKHGHPEHVEIGLFRKDDQVELTIRDDGTGISEVSERSDGLGLHIMNYRANIIGASFNIESDMKKGTVVKCVYHDNIAVEKESESAEI